eukprot:GDKI01033982.1.p1 GENE.GDKI01033982.1~~GDKI01033982.1.p1  ORF type:complete len:133 (-),score=10.89 GDKI01033982.1:204-602(-)
MVLASFTRRLPNLVCHPAAMSRPLLCSLQQVRFAWSDRTGKRSLSPSNGPLQDFSMTLLEKRKHETQAWLNAKVKEIAKCQLDVRESRVKTALSEYRKRLEFVFGPEYVRRNWDNGVLKLVAKSKFEGKLRT